MTVAALVVALVSCAGAAAADYVNPVLAGDFPDPGVLFDPATRLYWVASTGANSVGRFPLHSSADLVHWTEEGAVFPTAAGTWPKWAGSTPWAPEIHITEDGTYNVYVRAQGSGVQAGVSHSRCDVLERWPLQGAAGFAYVAAPCRYFVTDVASTSKLCVAVAVSKSVRGPFVDVLGHPLVQSMPADCFVRGIDCRVNSWKVSCTCHGTL